MKQLLLALLFILVSGGLNYAQTPESFSYQAVVRNDQGNIIKTQEVSMRISLLRGTATGSVVYSEEHAPTTSEVGKVSLKIGKGTTITGSFTNIDWSNGPYFVKIELDETGGSNYKNMGTSQLLSVPYALQAKKAENAFSGDYNDLNNAPSFRGWDKDSTDEFSGVYDSLKNKPDLEKFVDSSSAFTGVYDSLKHKPVFNKNGNVGIHTQDPVLSFQVASGQVMFGRDTVGNSRRLLWHPKEAAFRVGAVAGSQWTPDSLDFGSIGIGYDNQAKGIYSVAIGKNTQVLESNSYAIGENASSNVGQSYAIGQDAKTNGVYSYAFGWNAQAKGRSSYAFGDNAQAGGQNSYVIGDSRSLGFNAFAMGVNNEATGDHSLTVGNSNKSPGEYAYAFGNNNTTSGTYSMALGNSVKSISGWEMAIGRYNTEYTANDTTGWNQNDRLLVVGNGSSPSFRSDAFKIMKDARTGIDLDTQPQEKLHVNGAARVEKTTTSPNPKTLYGNSMPLAYGYVNAPGDVRLGDYGIESVNKPSTGEYVITLENGWVDFPAINITLHALSSNNYNVTYSFTDPNQISVHVVDGGSNPADSGFSIIVHGKPE